MGNMNEALDEILFGLKPKKKKGPLREKKINMSDIFEAEEQEKEDLDGENTEDEKEAERDKEDQDKKKENSKKVVLEVQLRINKDKSSVKIDEETYSERAITDFVSAISLFKTSKNLKVKTFLSQLTGAASSTTSTATQSNLQLSQSLEQPTTSTELEQKSIQKEEAELGSGLEAIPSKNKEQEEFKLSSFSLRIWEKVSQTGAQSVAITGEENINDMMSFKVSLGEDSTAFNTPESALAHFNRVFFDNIIKTIDKEIEKRNE